MFRFPFRTSASELSGTLYTEATIRELITNIKNCSSKLILFLQHIKCITFSRIDQGEQSPTVLLQITKESRELISGALAEVKKLRCFDQQSSQTHEGCWLIANHTDSIGMEQATASVACLLEVTTSSQCYNVMKIEGEIFCFLPLAQKTGLPVHVSHDIIYIIPSYPLHHTSTSHTPKSNIVVTVFQVAHIILVFFVTCELHPNPL